MDEGDLLMNSPVVFKRLADALKDIFLHIVGKDCDGAVRNDQENCIAARCARRIHHFERVVVMRNTVYARKRGSNLWRRWLIDHAGLDMVRKFDKTGRLPPEGIILRLVAPKGVRKLEYTRSKEFRATRSQSAERRKDQPRRRYRRDPLPEVRWGTTTRTTSA